MHLKDLEAMSEEDNISSVTPQTLDFERDRVCDMIAVSTSGLPTGIGMTSCEAGPSTCSQVFVGVVLHAPDET